MAYLIGTDEAGYGPNLGPLVISATVWRVPGPPCTIDLYDLLVDVVAGDGACDEACTVIADSKTLYKSGQGLAGLERGVHPAFAVLGKPAPTWQAVWRELQADPLDERNRLPWYAGFDCDLPLELSAAELSHRTDTLLSGLHRAGVQLVEIRGCAVFAPQFNEFVSSYGNKATALSQTTLGLVRDVLRELPEDEAIYVVCDKHGGRNKYGPLLQGLFPEWLVMTRRESRQESIYRMGPETRPLEIAFRAKGESFLPSALASMVSKYLRELAMRAFNRFWQMQVQDLRPTAGYPVDARRFKQQIAPAQEALAISDESLWRIR